MTCSPGGRLFSSMTCSGVSTKFSESSAPGMASKVRPLKPSAAQRDPVACCSCQADPAGVPAAPVFLTGGRVLRAADMAAILGAGVTDIAADALADLSIPSLLDLLREERVGD